MHEGTTQNNARWNGSGPRMVHDKKYGEGTLHIGQAGDMEGAAAGWTIQLAAP